MIADDTDTVRIPLVEERVRIGKTQVRSDHVRIRTVADEHTEQVDALLETGRLDVTRVPFDHEVTTAPLPRHDGDTLIVSLVEERLVKRLFLVEEVHVTRTTQAEAVTIPVPLRRMRAIVERDDAAWESTGRE